LKVIQNLQYVASKGLFTLESKTDKSHRMIALPGFVLDAFKEHLQKRLKLAKNPKWRDSGLVFTTDIGTPTSSRILLRYFKA
jgi:integrase